MYGRSLQCLNSKIYARNAQSQPFNFQVSGKSPYFQNSFFCLIQYISVSINATDAYYTSNDWKLSQLFAEPSRFELRGLHEELEALKQFSFFSPHPLQINIIKQSNINVSKAVPILVRHSPRPLANYKAITLKQEYAQFD